MIDSRTTIYLDVDGVLNVPRPHAPAPWDGAYLPTYNDDGPWTVSAHLIEHVNQIAARPDVRMTFCTWWPPRALPRLAALGLQCSEWPVMRRTGWAGVDDWKLAAVQADQAERPSRFVWVEDDLFGESSRPVWEWVAGTGRGGWLAPNPVFGLTPALVGALGEALDGRVPLAGLSGLSASAGDVFKAEGEWVRGWRASHQ